MYPYEEVLLRHGIEKRTRAVQIPLETIEARIGFPLPEDYKHYLENYKGFEGLIGEEYVQLWDLDELIEDNEDYLILNNLPQTLGIGGDRGGEFIALEHLPGNTYRIMLSSLFDEQVPLHMEIGISFSDFLCRLEKGFTWFEKVDA
jgi:hypothetical protein